jgi:3-phosphoshikimate 1-carboxyvinyltransferase
MQEFQDTDEPVASDLVVDGGRPENGMAALTINVPGDKSVSHRALLAALLPGAPPRLTVRNANLGGAVRALLPAMRALGRRVTLERGDLVVERDGVAVPQPVRPHPHVTDWPADVPYLETEGSSAAARLLIGVLAGAGVAAVVDGDGVLRHRPMGWLVTPLNELGAEIGYLGEPGRLPVIIRGRVHLSGTVELAVGSAQARSAVLLAAFAAGVTVEIRHPVRSRDHTERMLAAFGARLTESAGSLRYEGGGYAVPPVIDVPADPSLAAYPVAAWLLWGGTDQLRVPGVCLNPTRLGFFDVLRRSGADIGYTDQRACTGGETVGTIVARGGLANLAAVRVDDPVTLHALIDEVALLTAVSTALPGVSWLGCAGELRFKETDRLVTTAGMAAAFGAHAEVAGDGLKVTGGAALAPGVVPSYGDHRIAMAAATLAMSLTGRTTVSAGGSYRTSFPGFVSVGRAMGARITEITRR